MEKFTDDEMVSMKLARYNEMLVTIQEEKQNALFDRQIRDQLRTRLEELGYRLIFYSGFDFRRNIDHVLIVTTEKFVEYQKLENEEEEKAWLTKFMRKEVGLDGPFGE